MTKPARMPLVALFGLVVPAIGQTAAAASNAVANTAPERAVTGQATERCGGADTSKLPQGVQWTIGPGKVAIGEQAEIQLPDGVRFTGADGARTLLETMHNPTDGRELGLLTTDALDWFLVFEYEAIGYVKDADKDRLDPAAILQALRRDNQVANQERKKQGRPTIRIVGWHTPPFYDKHSQHLEWCLASSADGHDLVNCNTRILGRSGVMSASLLVAPEKLYTTLPAVKILLQGFSYVQGQKYSEWRPGDKPARYGLSALVSGGAAGGAAKMGLLARIGASIAKLWKVVIVGLLGALLALRSFFFGNDKKPLTDKQT